VDLVIPGIDTIIEFKYVKTGNLRTYVDELKVDIVSYPKHSRCGHLFCVVWDPRQLVTDRKSVVEDLAGPKTHGGRSFTVEVMFIP
jgi:REase_DpnII-MboI